MGGLLVLFLLVGYFWVAYKVVRWTKPVWGKALLTLVFVLVPTADAIYGRIELKQLCEAEGGLKIHRTVEGVEGFYAERGDDYDDWITKYGYQFVEGKGGDKGFTRKTLEPDGKVAKINDTSLNSEYRLSQESSKVGPGLNKHKMVVSSRKTGDEIGTFTHFGFEGGWVERFVASLYAQSGFAGDCGPFNAFDKKVGLVTGTLLKSKQASK